MNVPNLLSIFRLVLTIFFVLAVYHGEYRLALLLFAIQGVSDLLDGFFARIMGKKTKLGALLDPVADKTMLVSSYVALSFKGLVPIWVTSVVLVRDATLAIGFLTLYKLAYHVDVLPSVSSKITTALQILTVVYVLWSPTRTMEILFFSATVIFTVVSGAQYVARGIGIARGK